MELPLQPLSPSDRDRTLTGRLEECRRGFRALVSSARSPAWQGAEAAGGVVVPLQRPGHGGAMLALPISRPHGCPG
jgi:hypothetical protein